MPMDFPDMKSLELPARIHKFRKPGKDEAEEEYCEALADYVSKIDLVESQEIRHSVGWDKFNDAQKFDLVVRGIYK